MTSQGEIEKCLKLGEHVKKGILAQSSFWLLEIAALYYLKRYRTLRKIYNETKGWREGMTGCVIAQTISLTYVPPQLQRPKEAQSTEIIIMAFPNPLECIYNWKYCLVGWRFDDRFITRRRGLCRRVENGRTAIVPVNETRRLFAACNDGCRVGMVSSGVSSNRSCPNIQTHRPRFWIEFT